MTSRCVVFPTLYFVIPAKAGIHHPPYKFRQPVMAQLQVGSFPERSLNMRGMFNLQLLRGGDEVFKKKN